MEPADGNDYVLNVGVGSLVVGAPCVVLFPYDALKK